MALCSRVLFIYVFPLCLESKYIWKLSWLELMRYIFYLSKRMCWSYRYQFSGIVNWAAVLSFDSEDITFQIQWEHSSSERPTFWWPNISLLAVREWLCSNEFCSNEFCSEAIFISTQGWVIVAVAVTKRRDILCCESNWWKDHRGWQPLGSSEGLREGWSFGADEWVGEWWWGWNLVRKYLRIAADGAEAIFFFLLSDAVSSISLSCDPRYCSSALELFRSIALTVFCEFSFSALQRKKWQRKI